MKKYVEFWRIFLWFKNILFSLGFFFFNVKNGETFSTLQTIRSSTSQVYSTHMHTLLKLLKLQSSDREIKEEGKKKKEIKGQECSCYEIKR